MHSCTFLRMICLDPLPFNLHCRYNLTQASNVFKVAPRSLFWSPMDSTSYWKKVLNIALQPDCQIGNGFFNRPTIACTKILLGAPEQGFGTGSQTDFTRCSISSVVQATSTLATLSNHGWILRPCSLYKYFSLRYKHPIIILQTIHV